jgi:hypothetical protein
MLECFGEYLSGDTIPLIWFAKAISGNRYPILNEMLFLVSFESYVPGPGDDFIP